jgi:hypothetical protein
MNFVCKTLFVSAALGAIGLAQPALAANDVVGWNKAAVDAVVATKTNDLATSRALAVVHRAMFDAWSAYDAKAVGVRLDTRALRRPEAERTGANKTIAVSYAAYRALVDLFPSETARFDAVLKRLKLYPLNESRDPATAAGIGNLAAAAELNHAHQDGANQLGNLSPGAYSDYTGYTPPNPADRMIEVRRHQPIMVPDGKGGMKPGLFGGAHWPLIKPFALYRSNEFRPAAAPTLTGSEDELRAIVQHIIDVNARLTDHEKAIAEFWTLNPGTPTPPGQWHRIGQFLSEKRSHSLDDDIKMFFVLANALHDAGIAKIETKMHYLTARPETLIRHMYAGQKILAWGGRGKGPQIIDGADFKPYRPTAASPEHVSGHSAFGVSAGEALRLFTGSDDLGYTIVVKAGSFMFDDGPAADVVLSMATLTEAERDIASSGVYGQAHFITGELMGRQLGRKVAGKVFSQAMRHINGSL